MTAFSGLPLVVCGTLKIAYDLAAVFVPAHQAARRIGVPDRCQSPGCSSARDGGLVERGTTPRANFRASSLAQKWMKNIRGCSSSM